MSRLINSVWLGAAFAAGFAATAYAQSVATLPPSQPPSTVPVTAPVVSNVKIHPDPGRGGSWQELHQRAQQSANDPGQHPYTTPHFGPAPN